MAIWKLARVLKPPWDTSAGAVQLPATIARPLNTLLIFPHLP